MKNRLLWAEHLCWLLGTMYLDFLKGDIRKGVDTYYWIHVHHSYKGKLVAYDKLSFWKSVKIALVQTFGLLFTLFFTRHCWQFVPIAGIRVKQREYV